MMKLQLHNTLTRNVDPFEPLDPKNVRMYVCGPTVYDFAHIGNARPVIVFDVLFRLLRHLYGAEHVTYVRNITDVDDKINARAAEEYPQLPLNKAIREVTEKTDKQFHEDVAALGCLPPTFEPRATEHIAEMKALIEMLYASKLQHAYIAEDHVLFSVPSMSDYGQLSKQPLDEMVAGARVEVAPYKKDPRDFVLWKPSKPGEPAWPSPLGIKAPGRPGWHIECSAMAWKYLGEMFDIHGGGIDLVFPHHEDEIAQSRCAFHAPVMANYWMHNGFLRVEGEKMSKSLGNFRTIAELRSDWQGQVIRYQMLMTHYHQPIDWTETNSREAQFIVDRWYEFLEDNRDLSQDDSLYDSDVIEALLDDLNTPAALARMAKLFDRAKRETAAARSFISTARLLGFLDMTPEKYLQFYHRAENVWPKSSPEVPLEIKKFRDEIRAKANYAAADYLRNVIYLYGYRVADLKDGQSELIPAGKDYFSIPPTTKSKLSKLVKLAMGIARHDAHAQPSEYGFTVKFNRTFNYTREYLRDLSDAANVLEHDVGGAISEEDLNDVVVDVVLSNLHEAAKFGPDVVVSAVLFKLLSGVINQWDVYIKNQTLRTPPNTPWQIGNISTVSKLPSSELDGTPAESLLNNWKSDAGSYFRVRMDATRTTIRDRVSVLIRAYVSATRILLNVLARTNAIISLGPPEVIIPPLGILEQDALAERSPLSYFAAAGDGTRILPGRRTRFPYQLSKQIVAAAQQLSLFQILDEQLRLELLNPIRASVLALDRLTRARISEDPFERLHWNLQAVEIMCRPNDEDVPLSQAFFRAISEVESDGKRIKQLSNVLSKLIELRHRVGFVTTKDSTLSQAFAEDVVASLLATTSSVNQK